MDSVTRFINFVATMTQYNSFFEDIKELLAEFLGQPQRDSDATWIQYCCPCCSMEKGVESDGKYNLEVSIEKNAFHCWVCGDTMGTKGKLGKLIKMYGGPMYYRRFVKIIEDMRQSQLYNLNGSVFGDQTTMSLINSYKTQLTLPKDYKPLKHSDPTARDAYAYLYSRGLNDQIIEDFQIGYIGWADDYKYRNRIIVPSYDCLDELNYWIARDYAHRNQKFRYNNPTIPKTSFAFNEGRLNWYEDITLVEGVFDHIVTPNSMPLLGKTLNKEDAVYKTLEAHAMANVNIMLDSDAYNDAMRIYSTLNSSEKLHGKVRFIPIEGGKDPSDIYRDNGPKGIINMIKKAEPIDEFDLTFKCRAI